MAVTSGTVTTNQISHSYFYVKWSRTEQDIANNRDKIHWVAGLYTGTSSSHDYFYSNAVKIYNVYVNGTKVSSGGTWSNIKTGGEHDLLSGDIYVEHNADGTKSFDISISAWTYSSSNYSGSSSFTLPDIPRKATATSATNFNDEGNPVFNYTNNAGNAVSSLQACIASNDGNTIYAAYRDISKTGNSYTFNLTSTERNALRTACTGKTMTVRFYIKTVISGNTYHDFVTATMSIVNANPFIDTISYSDINSATTDITNNDQIIIQGMSRLQFQMYDVESFKGATLASLSINVNGNVTTVPFSGTSIASTTYTYGEVDVSENTTIILTLTDSRGFSTSYNVPITVWEYSQPTAIITVGRVSNFYSNSNIKVDAKYSSLNNLNTIDIKYRIKKTTENNWGNWTSLSDNVQASFTADNEYAWDLQVYLEDIFETSNLYTINKALDVGIPIVFYDVNKRSVGVNCFPDKNETLMLKGIDLSNTYSTTEQKVGYWIDGKPIYRKVFTQSNMNAISNVVSNLDSMIKMDCLVRQSTVEDWRNVPWVYVSGNSYGSATWAGGFYYDSSENKIIFQAGSNLSDIDKLIMIIEYTKTTD